MQNHKYLRDGRKVVVVGVLNSQESIVQEIFVAENGEEFPAGENFVAKGLLDKPAETYADRQLSEKAATLAKIEKSIDAADKKRQEVERRLRKTNLYDGVLNIYQDKTPGDIQTLLAFMSGEITHVVFENYGAPEIVELLDALEYTEHRDHFCGLKLVTLFGVKNERPMRRDDDNQLSLEWRIGEYCSASSHNKTIYPCRGLEEAVKIVDNILAEKDVSQEAIGVKEKYGLANPTDDRIQQWRQEQRKSAEERIAKLTAEIAKLREI